MNKRPNIIFFHAESWDGRMLGNMGHPALRSATPNLDRIARAGTQFDNTYCTQPICCPSRATMWSGQYTPHCESWNNPSSDYWAIMDNCFTGYDRQDEETVLRWLGDGKP